MRFDPTGDWALEAYLVGDQASDRCDFTIEAETTPPVIGEIWIEPLSDEPVCPEDEAYVYVQVSDESGVGSVELWTRYPAAAGSGSWVPAEMSAIGDQRYRYPLTAYEEPGTEFYVYAEDVYGNSARSDVQVYTVGHCPTVLYDFVAEANTAQWSHRYGLLPFPGDVDDDRGFALWQDDVHMEDGSREAFVLVTHPAWDDYDYVEGIYDQTQGIFIKAGDLFVARIGFLADTGDGEVSFRLLFSNVCEFGEFYVELGVVHEFYDEEVQEWTLYLDEIVGQEGCFALRVESGEIPLHDDWAAWVVARLERP